MLDLALVKPQLFGNGGHHSMHMFMQCACSGWTGVAEVFFGAPAECHSWML